MRLRIAKAQYDHGSRSIAVFFILLMLTALLIQSLHRHPDIGKTYRDSHKTTLVELVPSCYVCDQIFSKNHNFIVPQVTGLPITPPFTVIPPAFPKAPTLRPFRLKSLQGRAPPYFA